MSSIASCVTWVKGLRRNITAQRIEFLDRAEATRVKQEMESKGRRVVLAVSNFKTPERVVKVYVLTARPVPTYEKHAQKAKGYGITGNEPTREPNEFDQAEAKKDKKG